MMMAEASSGLVSKDQGDRRISVGGHEKIVYKVVLTGGPCAGKTTALVRIGTFFEQIGWKVFMIPEAATILFRGIHHSRLKIDEMTITESILGIMMNLEETFMNLASHGDQNCLIVCDRGTMDPSACEPRGRKLAVEVCTEESWQQLMERKGWNYVTLRDERYDQIVYMESAAKGAEEFYQLTNNTVRTEGLELAREMDTKAAQAWVGHPYCDVIDNSTDFENKLRRVIAVICKRLGNLGVQVDERLKAESRKRKFLVKSVPSIEAFPKRFQDFDVQHDFLLSNDSSVQARIRKRQQKDYSTYTLTERVFVNGKPVEMLRQLTKREYMVLFKQRDPSHSKIQKVRRCFHWHGHYFQLDIFKEPATCENLVILETYTHQLEGVLQLPSFIPIEREVTGDTAYSMFHLSQL